MVHYPLDDSRSWFNLMLLVIRDTKHYRTPYALRVEKDFRKDFC